METTRNNIIYFLMFAKSKFKCNFARCFCFSREWASSETQGRSLGPEEKARRKFSSTGGKAPGYWLSPDCFQTVKRMLALDWAQKILCLIVSNRRTASPESFSWVCTRRLLTRSRLVWLHPRRPRDSQSGREKRRDESFQVRAKEPLGTDSNRTISKNSSGCRLLIGHKKCFVLLCPIGEQFLLSSLSALVRAIKRALKWLIFSLLYTGENSNKISLRSA